MKRIVFGITAVVLALCNVPQAAAASFLRIDVNGTTLTCDNTSAVSLGLCAAGFSSSVGATTMTFSGTVNGVTFGTGIVEGVQLFSNSPGNATIAFVLDSKTALQNVSGLARTVTVDFAGNFFTAPVGTGFLNASQTANWTTSTAADTQAFTAWQRNDNAFIIPGPGLGGATAASPLCASPGGLSQSCASETLNVAATPAAPFALTGREVINMAPGTIASYSGTVALTAEQVPVIPEPSTIVLLGSGMLLLAGRRFLSRRK